MSSEVNEVNVSADSVFICIKITYWVRVRRPRQATAPTYSKNDALLDQPPLPRKNPRSAPGTTNGDSYSGNVRLIFRTLLATIYDFFLLAPPPLRKSWVRHWVGQLPHRLWLLPHYSSWLTTLTFNRFWSFPASG